MKMTKRLGYFFLIILIAASFSFPVMASSKTNQMIKDAENKKNEMEDDLDSTKNKISDLKNQKSGLEADLNELKNQVSSVENEISDLDSKIETKEQEITATRGELAEAKRQVEIQYSAMKKRIQYMYENQTTGWYEIFFEAESMSDLLNRAEYYNRMAEYDRDMLQKFQDTQEEVTRKEQQLEQEQQDLVALKEEATAKQEKLNSLVKKTSNKISQYSGAISEAEQEAEAKEQQIREQEGTIEQLKQKAKEEQEIARRAREQDKNKPNDNYVIDPGSDLAALAAIVECEAGGESYEGKVGVANVVLNRVRSGYFPNSVMGVITQGGQFTPVSSGRFYMVLNRGANGSCVQAAQDALNGTNVVGDALFFRTVIPGIEGQVIGNHIFY